MTNEDFYFRAPLHKGRGSKADYFAGTEHKTRFIHAFRILRQWSEDEVCTVYELDIHTPEGLSHHGDDRVAHREDRTDHLDVYGVRQRSQGCRIARQHARGASLKVYRLRNFEPARRALEWLCALPCLIFLFRSGDDVCDTCTRCLPFQLRSAWG